MLVLKGNLCIFLFSPALSTSSLCLDAQQCFNNFEGEKVRLWKTPAVFICSFSTLSVLEHWSIGTQAKKKVQGEICWRFGKGWCLWEGSKTCSHGMAQVSFGRWGCFAGMCFFRESCASGRGCLVLSAAVERSDLWACTGELFSSMTAEGGYLTNFMNCWWWIGVTCRNYWTALSRSSVLQVSFNLYSGIFFTGYQATKMPGCS